MQTYSPNQFDKLAIDFFNAHYLRPFPGYDYTEQEIKEYQEQNQIETIAPRLRKLPIKTLAMQTMYIPDKDAKDLVINIAIEFFTNESIPFDYHDKLHTHPIISELREILDLSGGECSPGYQITDCTNGWYLITINESY